MTGVMLLLASCGLSLLVIAQARLRRIEANSGIAVEARWTGGEVSRPAPRETHLRIAFEALGTALFVLVVVCVATGALLSSSITHDVAADGRALLACALGPLAALVWRDALEQPPAGAAIGVVSTLLLVSGLTGHALALQAHPASTIVVACALTLAVVASGVLAHHTWRRAQRGTSALQRARRHTEMAAALCMCGGALSAAIELAPGAGSSSLWAMCAAVAVSAAVSARTAAVAPARRDLVVVAMASAVGLIALPISAAVVVVTATAIAVTATAGLSAVRTVVNTPSLQPPATHPAVLTVQAGTELLTPLLDDATLRRPMRPRVVTRTSIRRLLEAAVDTAWRAQPTARGRPPVEVTAEGDPDVDGDIGELGEALCAIVDNALCEQLRHPEQRITIAVRATASTVSIDVVDGSAPALVGEWRPFLVGAGGDGQRPGFGVSLARAQILVERHGGHLSVGRGAGAAVHLSLPRRHQRAPVGVA